MADGGGNGEVSTHTDMLTLHTHHTHTHAHTKRLQLVTPQPNNHIHELREQPTMNNITNVNFAYEVITLTFNCDGLAASGSVGCSKWKA